MSNTRVEQSITIKGQKVTQLRAKSLTNCGFEVFTRQGENETDATIYVCRNSIVLFEVHVDAGMGQGVGYVSDVTVKDP